MNTKYIGKYIWFSLLLFDFVLTSCHSSEITASEPSILITPSLTSINSTQVNATTNNNTPTSIPTKENLPTEIQTQSMKPTTALANQLQLTYISTNIDTGKNNIYAMPVGCPEKSPPCLGKPELLFEYDSTIYNISWSPDGKQMVFFAVGNGGKGDIFVADWNGKSIRNITNSPNFEAWPTWSPDGTRIGYTRCSDGKCQFISVKPDGSDPVRLINKINIGLLSAVWSPDMSHILMSGSIEEGFDQIYMSEIDGSNLQKLTNNLADHYSQIYSPDGSLIAYGQFSESGKPEDRDIYILNLFNNEQINLTNGSISSVYGVQWSSIGNWLTFGGKNNDTSTMYLMHPDGSDLIEVTPGNQKNFTPAWRYLP